jgi:O-methyltransferase
MIKEDVPGNWVECGVACGNNLASMCAAGRWGFGFDSFEGIPWAGENDDCQPGLSEKTSNTGLSSSGVTVHSLEDCKLNMARWGIENYTLVKGWFQNTIPLWANRYKVDQGDEAVEEIAILRLDGDLYDSTLVPLTWFYPLVSKGGIIIMDDWNLAGARKAWNDYFFYSEIKPEEIYWDGNVKYFRKWA